ncbi:MAG: DUF2116 family Zn-ribbon domain-containing protein [Thermoplasmata archaeon]|nr:DUF2116 family Zn-ribbon domain-containing protein [Thermoplasmata archaeon]
MAERLVQHKHCPICGKAMSADQETCSDECAIKRQTQMQEKKRTLYLFYFSMLVLVVVLGLQFMSVF